MRDERSRRRLLGWTTALLVGVALLWVSGLAPDVWRGAYAAAAHASRPAMDPGAIEQGYRNMVGDIVRVGFLALIALGAVLATLRGALKPAIAAAIIAAITLIDLTVVNERILTPVLGTPQQNTAAADRDDVVDFLVAKKAEGQFRIFPVREFQSNRYAGFGIASLGGYHAAKPALYQRFLDADSGRAIQSPGAWRLLNVRYIVIPGLLPPESGFTEVFRGQQQVVYEFPGALPRATLVPAFIVAPRDSHLAMFRDPLHDAAQVTLLTEDPGITPAPGGTAKIVDYGLNKVRIETDTPGPSILRLADLDFPGWRVTIDGREAKGLSADFLVRAVAVPAGRHDVVWEFHDPAFEHRAQGLDRRVHRHPASCSAPRTGTSGGGAGAAGRRPRPSR